jgi:hypothetical protein
LGLEDLLQNNWIPTYSSVVYRRGLVTTFPEWHRSVACGDWGLHILHAEHGDFGFLPEIMTHYRVHGSGLWSGMGEVRRIQQKLTLWEAIDAHYSGRYSPIITAARERFLAESQREFDDLRKIETRYHQLQLDHIAAVFRWIKSTGQKLLDRSPK